MNITLTLDADQLAALTRAMLANKDEINGCVDREGLPPIATAEDYAAFVLQPVMDAACASYAQQFPA
jgi:hypothetical protein